MQLKRLKSALRYFRDYPHRVKPFLPRDAFVNPPQIYTGPRDNLYEQIRSLLRTMGLLRLARRMIGLRLIMTARHFFVYSPNTPTDAHSRYNVHPYFPEVPFSIDLASDDVSNSLKGVNVVGYLHSSKGLGQSARNLLRCLSAVAIPVSAYSIREREQMRIPRADRPPPQIYPKYPISIFGVNADQSLIIEDLLSPAFYRGRYNVGYWYWEIASFPERWKSTFDLYDEIWVASRFTQQALQAQTQTPVYRFPLPIEVHVSPLSRSQLALPDDQFIVLFIFDAISIVERKNPWAVVHAYERAFSASERQSAVKLVIKANNLDNLPGVEQRLQAEIARVDGLLINRQLNRPSIIALLNTCDVYISLHRSEGFGLTLADAMFLGKPVIGTAYSGNLDFMREDNSYLVPFRLIEIPGTNGFYDAHGVWADADVDAAAHALRDVYSHRPLAREKGRRAAQFIREYYNPLTTGREIEARLGEIRKRYCTCKPLGSG